MATGTLIDDLSAAVGRLSGMSPAATCQEATDALILAGELECALADHEAPGAAIAAGVTDGLAETLFGGRRAEIATLAQLALGAPAFVCLSPPESFSWYGLQPESFARLAANIEIPSGAAAVIGIRSIGTTLSAVVAAALRRRGLVADRITVRPSGHPYDRVLSLDAAARAWIAAGCERSASFLVIDEGPGMSGSSFLSVGEALAGAGVDPRRVAFLGTRAADPSTLLAKDAVPRFAMFGGLFVAPPTSLPEGASIDVSGGLWRAWFCASEARWPATWPASERIKHLSVDGRRLFKFEGLGRSGEAARGRILALAEAGFGPKVEDAGGGFVSYPVLLGRPLSRGDRSPGLVERLADYCAFRAGAFPAEVDEDELRAMVRWNSEVELGRVIDEPLPVERPTVPDARMDPHEWIDAGGALSKIDAAAHGDDHGYPGPTDVAWDLAGALVEWDLDGAARAALLARYARASGDRGIARRLDAYVRAYALARMARAKMAAGAMEGTSEAERLLADYARYRRALDRASVK